VLAALTAQPAIAARPLNTDDARTVDHKACQVESWFRKNETSREFWSLPACNPFGAELTFGGALVRENGETHTGAVQAQAKMLFKTLEPNGMAYGLVLGHLEPKGVPDRSIGANLYGYVPASFSFWSDAFVVHVNVGALRPAEERSHRVTWGLGSETRLHRTLFLIAEGYRQEAAGPHYQLGLRYWIVPDRVQVDATIGDRLLQHSNGGRWFTIGLRLLTPPFLP
jgi:hypothetical protein